MTLRLAHALDFGVLAPFSGPILAINAHNPADLVALPQDGLQVQQADYMAHAALLAAGFSVSPQVEGRFAGALIRAARNREQTFGLMAQAVSMVDIGGIVLLDGAKSDGIDAMARSLKVAGLNVETHAKAHGKLTWFYRPETLPNAFIEWAARAGFQENADGFITAPGMFSHAKPDAGSQFLAEFLPEDLTGTVADFGAGWGWLSAAVLSRNSALEKLHLVEADHSALAAARRNITDRRARFHWGDATQKLGHVRFDAIVMNPPFHRQGATNPDLGREFITSAAAQLGPAGQLYMVANRQLPYEATLAGLFGEVSTLAQSGVYKVISAARPKRRGT
ncbi:MAG: class I SAM-dependent methyltransferase [Paracoccaceae bacterium]